MKRLIRLEKKKLRKATIERTGEQGGLESKGGLAEEGYYRKDWRARGTS